MAIRFLPSVVNEPVPSQAGGINGRVEPMRDASAGSLLAVGEGLQRLGVATTNAADQLQDQVDIAQSLRMRNLYTAEVERALQDPKDGFLSAVGMDANAERRKRAFDKLREQRKKIEELGQNDVQRLNFTSYADRTDAESAMRADVHQERETKHFLAGEKTTAANISITRAIRLVGTEEGDLARMEAMQGLESLADLYGWPKGSKQREALLQGATDKLHAGVIEQYTQDPMSAPQAALYLAKHRQEMSPNVLNKSVDEVRRTMSIGRQQQIDAAGWAIANELADSGRSIDDQRKEINRRVQSTGDDRIPPEVAMKALALTQNIDDNKWQARQRERSSSLDELKQMFAKDENLSVDTLSADWKEKVDRLGLLPEATKAHSEVRMQRIANLIGDGSVDSLVLSRDVRTIGELTRLREVLYERIGNIQGDEAKSPQGIEKKKRLEKQAASLDQMVEALVSGLANRTYVMPEDLPNSARPDNSTTPTPPTDMQKFAESIRKALYPSSGR